MIRKKVNRFVYATVEKVIFQEGSFSK